MIVKVKDGFLVFNHDRSRMLGKHASYAQALAQLRAIEASKARAAKGMKR